MTLTELRKSKNLTCKEMAEKLNMPYNTYRNKEYGQIVFKINEIWDIAEILNISCDKIIMCVLQLDEEKIKNANKFKRLSRKIQE